MSKFEDSYTQLSVYIEKSLVDKLQQVQKKKEDNRNIFSDALKMYFNRNEQIQPLFNLLDELVYKQLDLNRVTEVLGADENHYLLNEAIVQVELLIVKAYGGNEEHYRHISSTELFHNYEWYAGEEHRKELVEYIKLTVENNWTNEVGITIL
ncbi:hypothetical protein [Lentibacillus sediminis]|uniref:hypothetical protein n=1 Tax=Lentibacillus sediminis TaxID=1940529 RepID=UPI000C1BB52A|nr:hypothetical protein [Lentibacillus sediminis]